MKKGIIFLLWIGGFCTGYAQHFRVTLHAPAYKSGIAYLTYYMGSNLNVEDSAVVNDKGTAVFSGARTLPGGIYVVVLPDKKYRIDFLVDKEQTLNINVDTADIFNKSVVSGSKENGLYAQYQKFTASKGALLEKERQAYNAARTKKDSALHEANYLKVNKEINNYRSNIITQHPASMLAVLFLAMKEPTLLINEPKNREDSLANYTHFKNHFWDGITFMDERIIRTPFFIKKLEQYYGSLVVVPDSIIKDMDYQLLLARSCPEMYKFLLNWFTDKFISPKYMGQDAVFVHLFEKYHSKELSSWLNEKQMETISRRAYMLMANLIGEKAANLNMIDSLGNPMPLYNVSADYTIICFWDPTCGHCKEIMPQLDSVYRASWKQHNVKIYAVLSEHTKDEWIKYTQDHQLNEWIHVYQTNEMEAAESAAQKAGFRQLYDVTQTPTLYLLDKEKRIIGKKLTWQQLNELLIVKWK